MYIVTAIVTGAGVVLALMLHSGKAPAPMADRQPASAGTRAAAPRDTRPVADGVPEHRNGAAESHHGPPRTAPQREELEPERASSAP
jgi:hypothetical protein